MKIKNSVITDLRFVFKVILFFILVLSFVLFLIFFSMGGVVKIYGIPLMCARVGGIWCYWPSFRGVINFFVFVVLIFFVVWIIKKFSRLKKN